MKLLLLMLIFLSIATIGYIKSRNYYKRLRFLTEFRNMLTSLKLKIDLVSVDILKALEEFKANSYDLKNLIKTYINHLKNEDIMLDKFNFEIIYLSLEEKNTINALFENLGQFTKQLEIDYIENNIKIFDNLIEKLKLKEKEEGQLPLKLALSIGAVIIIILI